MAATTKDKYIYTFVTKRENRESIELLRTEAATDDALVLKILKGSLTANNKFYNDFGEKPPLNFFKCYPIDSERSNLVDNDDNEISLENYAHPVAWGIAQVEKSELEDVKVGTRYLAQLPIGDSVSFKGAKVDPDKHNALIIERSGVLAAYNVFQKWDYSDGNINEDLALACFPGIITGYGLNFNLRHNDYYGADAVVLTAASSKVSLALAIYLRHNSEEYPSTNKKIIGYTSESNKEFCQKTGLYDEVLGYEDTLKPLTGATKSSFVVIDTSGKGSVYEQNSKEDNVKIVKLLSVGNASGTPDKQSTGSSFSIVSTFKLILGMLGAPRFLLSWLNPTLEIYFIALDLDELNALWGKDKAKATQDEYTKIFCDVVDKNKWISVRTCDTEESIQQGFSDICQGNVPPSETIVLEMTHALEHRKH